MHETHLTADSQLKLTNEQTNHIHTHKHHVPVSRRVSVLFAWRSQLMFDDHSFFLTFAQTQHKLRDEHTSLIDNT